MLQNSIRGDSSWLASKIGIEKALHATTTNNSERILPAGRLADHLKMNTVEVERTLSQSDSTARLYALAIGIYGRSNRLRLLHVPVGKVAKATVVDSNPFASIDHFDVI